MPRNPDVSTTPLVDKLRETGQPIEDVVALVGFVGEAPNGFMRLHPEPDLQAWMDFPLEDVYNSSPANPGNPEGRTVVWMFRERLMASSVFSGDAAAALQGAFVEGEMSVWPLLPDSRYVAAELLGLIDGGRGRY